MKYLLHFSSFILSFILIKTSESFAAAPYGGIYENCPNVASDPQKEELSCVVNHTINLSGQIIGGILVAVIIIAGIMYMTSMGNPEKVGVAKKTLVGAIIGLIIVVLSGVMVNAVMHLFG